ncbi:hypothetical protein RFI_28435 [Reticulomyxa filosa]|uniref:Uncharacterized protein n=1 Tax=Reticulomyxa filosa TaxID=46433 RepID=X6M4X9_RETFI|nr:hypothetical protein RFI_28435 [Reticulomyxa filosa]|eukprot:ETO08954.1 hypothetical protein RFI_28435 [Reticulomyxa filosa]
MPKKKKKKTQSPKFYNRCDMNPNSNVPDSINQLYYVSPNGEYIFDTNISKYMSIERGSVLTFELVVRNNGESANAMFISESNVLITVNYDFGISLTTRPKTYLNLIPLSLLPSGTTFTLTIFAYYIISPDDTVKHSVNTTFTFSTRTDTSAFDVAVYQAWHLYYMSPLIPPIIVSLNQIGFESVDLLISIVAVDNGDQNHAIGSSSLVLTTSSLTVMPFNIRYNGNSFILEGYDMYLVTGGPIMPINEFRIASNFFFEGHNTLIIYVYIHICTYMHLLFL